MMKTRTKTILVIAGTLIIGIILGVFLTGAVMRHRLNRIAEMQTRPGFVKIMEHIIQPTEKQKKEIEPILTNTAHRLTQVYVDKRKKIAQIGDSLRSELQPYLTDEQYQRLTRRMRHHEREHRKWRHDKDRYHKK
ncbi:MAG TPA: hypothetical protein VJ991_09235 [Balneolales bacterium]|nr:hypothetical protein [Balneolales bacterium]